MSFNIRNRSFTVLLLTSILFAGSACSRPNTVYPGEAVAVIDDTPVVVDPIALPGGFFDQSVNRASAFPYFDELDNAYYLKLETRAGLYPVSGSFNGPGLGNRALVGVSLYDGLPVEYAANNVVEIRSYTNSDFKLLLVADLECDGSDIRVIEGEPLSIPDSSFALSEFGIDGTQWKISGSDLLDPYTSDSF
jgi:hypothetical protein